MNKCQPKTAIGKNWKMDLQEQKAQQFGFIEDTKVFAAAIEDTKVFAAATLLDPRYKRVGFTADERKPIRVANAMDHVGKYFNMVFFLRMPRSSTTLKLRSALDTSDRINSKSGGVN